MIKYHDGYKYQLIDDYTISLAELQPEHSKIWSKPKILTDYINLYKGDLTIYHGYAWDGPSGPTIDTKNFMRGSLVHDALYQLIREDFLKESVYRKLSDEVLRKICIEDGMWRLRACWVYYGVRFGGKLAATEDKPVYCAPQIKE